jgi:hypothetical protein
MCICSHAHAQNAGLRSWLVHWHTQSAGASAVLFSGKHRLLVQVHTQRMCVYVLRFELKYIYVLCTSGVCTVYLLLLFSPLSVHTPVNCMSPSSTCTSARSHAHTNTHHTHTHTYTHAYTHKTHTGCPAKP